MFSFTILSRCVAYPSLTIVNLLVCWDKGLFEEGTFCSVFCKGPNTVGDDRHLNVMETQTDDDVNESDSPVP